MATISIGTMALERIADAFADALLVVLCHGLAPQCMNDSGDQSGYAFDDRGAKVKSGFKMRIRKVTSVVKHWATTVFVSRVW